ncbi:hypothetical protein V2J09_011492 [Rumex salicifolius]
MPIPTPTGRATMMLTSPLLDTFFILIVPLFLGVRENNAWLLDPLQRPNTKRLQIPRPSSSASVLYCDNPGVTSLSANPFFLSYMKHIALAYQFVREHVFY